MLDAIDGRRAAQQGRRRAQAAASGHELTTLQVHPVTAELQAHLQRYMPEHSTDLVGIASRWADFQRIAQTMLVAAGLAPECLLVRDATRPGWKRGLEAASGVVCDAALEHDLPTGCHAIVFRLLGEPSLADLRNREAAILSASSH